MSQVCPGRQKHGSNFVEYNPSSDSMMQIFTDRKNSCVSRKAEKPVVWHETLLSIFLAGSFKEGVSENNV
jgi:hypothetical protein